MSTGEGCVTVLMDVVVVVQEYKCKRLRAEQVMLTASARFPNTRSICPAMRSQLG